MKKSTPIMIFILSLIAASVIFVLATKKSDAPPAQSGNPQSKTADVEKTAPKTSQYVDYDSSKLAVSKDDNYLFFHAPWCPQCRSIESSIYDGGRIPEKVTIFKVDYDSNQQLRKKYGVTLQTTFVKVDTKGNFIDKYVAYDNPTIESVVENFINKQ